MGATSSVSLTSEMAEKLSEQSVRTFKRFEEELCLRNVSPEEAQDLMIAKYNELLKSDKLRSNVDSDMLSRSPMLSPSQRLPSLQCVNQKSRRESTTRPIRSASFLKITAASAQKMVVLPDIKSTKANNVRRKGWGSDPQAKLRREERAKLFDAFSSLNKRPGSPPKRPGTSDSRPRTADEDGLTSHPLAFSESLPVLSLSNPSTDLPPPTHREAFLPSDWALTPASEESTPNGLGSKGLTSDSVDTVDVHDSCTDDESVCSTLTELSLTTESLHDDSPLSHKPHALPPPLKKTLSMIPESFDCKLCKKRFPTKALLHTHLSYSQLHRQHLLDLRRKYTCAYEEVDRIDQVLKKAVEQFYSLLTCQRLRKQAMRVHCREEVRLRWKQAVRKVVFQCQAKKVARFLEEMQEQALQAEERERAAFHSPPFLFYEDSKFFWRSKTRFALQYFVHENSHCIEVVPQLLPIAYREDLHGDGVGMAEGIFGKRVYLDSAVVLQAAREMAQRGPSPLGLPSPFARSESREGLWEETATLSPAVGLGEGETSPFPLGNGYSPSPLGGRGKGRLCTHAHALRDRSQARVVAAYINSKLRLDYSAVASGLKSLEQALYFDDHSLALAHTHTPTHTHTHPHPRELSPLLPSAPPGVTPVSLHRTRWYSAGEMCAKLDEVRVLQRELREAVCKAETLARRLEERHAAEGGGLARLAGPAGPGGVKVAREDGGGPAGAAGAVLPPLGTRGGLRRKHGARLAGVAL